MGAFRPRVPSQGVSGPVRVTHPEQTPSERDRGKPLQRAIARGQGRGPCPGQRSFGIAEPAVVGQREADVDARPRRLAEVASLRESLAGGVEGPECVCRPAAPQKHTSEGESRPPGLDVEFAARETGRSRGGAGARPARAGLEPPAPARARCGGRPTRMPERAGLPRDRSGNRPKSPRTFDPEPPSYTGPASATLHTLRWSVCRGATSQPSLGQPAGSRRRMSSRSPDR